MEQRRPTEEDSNGTPEDPPPAYEATPHLTGEQSLAFGPLRPFQPVFQPPPLPPRSTGSYQHPTHPPPLSPDGGIAPPQFPFWNGANLTPAQTGFSEGPYAPPPHPPPGQYGQPGPQGFSPPHGPPPPQYMSPQPATPPPKWAPTTVPTPGQPLLHQGRVLVYPPGHICGKCGNTGYKHNDPSHPCRKDWDKYAKPFTAAFRLAPTQDPAPNFQRPLAVFGRPQSTAGGPMAAPRDYNQPQYPQQRIIMSNGPPPVNALVLRPGDPRMGGALCRACGGRGNVVSMFSFFGDEETCYACRGAGRVF